MEKYSKWRDPGTGIAPFLPNKVDREYENVAVQLLWWLKRLIIGPALVIIRLPFVIIVFLWLLLFSFLAQLIPVPIIKRLFTKYIQFFGARLLLLLLGFWWIETRNFFISRQKRDSTTKVGAPGSTVKNGDIIVANHTSYIDVLYFTFRFSPVFTTVPTYWKESPPQGVVIRRGLVGALLDSIYLRSYKAGDATALSEVCKHAASYSEGPVVVFPEGTTTNGKTILAPVPALVTEQSLPRQCKIHVVGLKYECEDFSPSFSVGSFVWHFLRLLAQVHNKLEVRYLSEPDTPTLPLDATDREPTSADRDEWCDAIHRSLGAVLQIRKATLSVLDKQDFLQYWFSHKKTYKTK